MRRLLRSCPPSHAIAIALTLLLSLLLISLSWRVLLAKSRKVRDVPPSTLRWMEFGSCLLAITAHLSMLYCVRHGEAPPPIRRAVDLCLGARVRRKLPAVVVGVSTTDDGSSLRPGSSGSSSHGDHSEAAASRGGPASSLPCTGDLRELTVTAATNTTSCNDPTASASALASVGTLTGAFQAAARFPSRSGRPAGLKAQLASGGGWGWGWGWGWGCGARGQFAAAAAARCTRLGSLAARCTRLGSLTARCTRLGSLAARCTRLGSLAASLWPVVLVCGIHLVVHGVIPDRHRPSQEISMALARCSVDAALAAAFAVWCANAALRVNVDVHVSGSGSVGVATQHSPRLQLAWAGVRAGIRVTGCLALCALCLRAVAVVYSVDPLPHLRLCILDDQECDPCAAEGLQLNPMLRLSWVWPALTPRRLFTFYTGSEACEAPGWRPMALLDVPAEALVVAARCPDGAAPRLFFHRPENSELDDTDRFIARSLVGLRGRRAYHSELQERYGTPERAAARGALVHRAAESGRILSVEVDPRLLVPTLRPPASPAEAAARASWPAMAEGKVFVVPLGESPAYTLRCPGTDHEEYFLFPTTSSFQLSPTAAAAEAAATEASGRTRPLWVAQSPGEVIACKENKEREEEEEAVDADALDPDVMSRTEPAGNVLVILFDAVSRQAVRRTLPKFSAWLQDFHHRHRGGSIIPSSNDSRIHSNTRSSSRRSSGHIVVEPTALTTLGFSTAGNLAPYVTGSTGIARGGNDGDIITMTDTFVYNLAKERHGAMLHTSLAVGFCHDVAEIVIGNRRYPSGGAGGPLMGIDHYMYAPMCHLEYSALESNFQGPYSIIRRCIDNRHVHEHMFDYTTHLLLRQMRQRAAVLAAEKRVRRRGTAAEKKPSHTTTPAAQATEGRRPSCAAAAARKAAANAAKPGKFFFDLSYFTDGHEGTHSAITLVDDGLVAFLQRLEGDEVGFFKDPLNTLIFASDHGNHMGHYFAFTSAGKYERATPAMFYIIHPEVMRRVDIRKGRIPGEAEANFLTRAKRVTTPLDFYRTLGDLLGLDVVNPELSMRAAVAPVSLFEARAGGPVTQALDVSSRREYYVGAQHFCVPTEDAAASTAYVNDY